MQVEVADVKMGEVWLEIHEVRLLKMVEIVNEMADFLESEIYQMIILMEGQWN